MMFRAKNKEGLTYADWLYAATLGGKFAEDDRHRKAWRAGEDPTEWAEWNQQQEKSVLTHDHATPPNVKFYVEASERPLYAPRLLANPPGADIECTIEDGESRVIIEDHQGNHIANVLVRAPLHVRLTDETVQIASALYWSWWRARNQAHVVNKTSFDLHVITDRDGRMCASLTTDKRTERVVLPLNIAATLVDARRFIEDSYAQSEHVVQREGDRVSPKDRQQRGS